MDRDTDGAGTEARVVSLAGRRRSPGRPRPAAIPARGQPVAFGIELPARGDLVFSVAALTQLITLADQAGLDASGDLGRAIESLRRRLEANDVGLPPALDEMIKGLDLGAGAEVRLLPGGRG